MSSPVTTTRVRIDSVSFSRGKIREESITVRRFLLVRIRRGKNIRVYDVPTKWTTHFFLVLSFTVPGNTVYFLPYNGNRTGIR